MRKAYVFIVTFFLLYIAFNGIPLDYASSVVPGWHTTIYPPYFLLGVLNFAWWFLVFGAYLFSEVKKKYVSRTVFIIHMLLSLPLIFLGEINELVFISGPSHPERLLYSSGIVIGLFMLGQIIFIIYYIKAWRE
jgi:hypothetical protein